MHYVFFFKTSEIFRLLKIQITQMTQITNNSQILLYFLFYFFLINSYVSYLFFFKITEFSKPLILDPLKKIMGSF